MAHVRKRRSPRLTATIAAYIKWLWFNTALNQAQISATLGALNQGRVSEVVNSHRFADVQPLPYTGKLWNE